MAYRTEQAYLQWMRRFVKFHGRRDPRDLFRSVRHVTRTNSIARNLKQPAPLRHIILLGVLRDTDRRSV